MQEILNDAGVYFDPLNVSEIAEAMRILFDNFDLRLDLGAQASMLSRTYSWQKCAEQTFQFIAEVAMKRTIYQAV
jgi:glycosyltransferase involved in cell wall biosynthesis